MPLFGKSHKNPYELIKSLQEALLSLEKGDKKAEKALEDVSKNLVLMKNMLYGSGENEPQTDIAVAQLAQELYNSNLLLLLINNLSKIEFEGKKDVAQIFNNILRRQIGKKLKLKKMRTSFTLPFSLLSLSSFLILTFGRIIYKLLFTFCIFILFVYFLGSLFFDTFT